MPDTKLPLTTRAFLELKSPSAPHVNPDGRRVVFVVSEADFEESRWISRLWLAEIPDGRARRITHSYEGERCPRWSPDGRWIAFLSTRPDLTEPPPENEEEEDLHKEQLWLMPADGGEAQRLTNTKEGVRGYEWAPDSKTIIYLAAEARPQPIEHHRRDNMKRRVDPTVEHQEKLRQQFWEVDLEERKPELLYTGDYGIAEFALSPDGNQIVFSSNRTGEPNDYYDFDLHVLDLESGETRKLVERAGGKFQPQWSPDGARIAFLSNLDPAVSYSQECIWQVPAGGGEPANLFARVPYDAEDIHWSRSGALHAVVADRTNGPLARIEPGEVSVLPATSASDVSGFDCSPTGVTVAVLQDAANPPELYLLNDDGTRTPLTELNKPFLERYELPRQEVVRWQSDGMEIEGIVTWPSGDQAARRSGVSEPERPNARTPERLPLIVQIHGGPKGRSTNTLRSYHMHPVWAAEGYAVLRVNYRGSEGYGNDFAIANRRDLGGGDYRDIMAGVDHLVAQGIADPERLGVMGGSYGGYMTNWIIGHTDRFKAAVSMFGVFSLVTDYSNSELSRWDPDYMGAYYWEDPEIYRACSPATYLDKINTPVLILHGQSDNNTYISNSKEMYQALRQRGVTVEFAHYPREGHGLSEPNHKLDEMRRALAWMDRYVKGQGVQPLYRPGDKIKHDGYELIVTRAEDVEYANWHEEWGRLLEVGFSLASDDPVEAAWRFELAEMILRPAEGDACELRGVPVDAGGCRTLVDGEGLAVDIHPDKDTGRLSLGMAAAFQIGDEGGLFTLHVCDFPPVALAVGPKEEKPEEGDEPSAEPPPSAEAATPFPPDEGPPTAPQRPDTRYRATDGARQ